MHAGDASSLVERGAGPAVVGMALLDYRTTWLYLHLLLY